jgi:hypothetical protein
MALSASHVAYHDLYLMLPVPCSGDLAVLRVAFGPQKVSDVEAVSPSDLPAILVLADRVPDIPKMTSGAQYE